VIHAVYVIQVALVLNDHACAQLGSFQGAHRMLLNFAGCFLQSRKQRRLPSKKFTL
jgi:hypothetical protein